MLTGNAVTIFSNQCLVRLRQETSLMGLYKVSMKLWGPWFLSCYCSTSKHYIAEQCQSLHFSLDKHFCWMLRAQESLSMEARSKSIPIPKAKSSAVPAGKAKAKAKVKAKAKPEPAPSQAAKAAPKRAAARASWCFPCPHVTMNLDDYWWEFPCTTKNHIVYILYRLWNV